MNRFKIKLYRHIESLIKKIIRFKKNLNNENLDRAIRSAIYHTSTEGKKTLFLDYKNSQYFMEAQDYISKGLFINANWNFKVLDKALKLIGKKKSSSTLINVGAHIGSTCIPAIKKGYFKKAIAFEPSRKNCSMLKANIHLNMIEDKIKVYNLALSNEKKKIYLKKFGKNSGDVRVLKKIQKNSEIAFADILDNYTSKFNKKNSIIFMYAQGHEPEIFMGAKKTIRKKIPIIVEFIPWLFNKRWLNKSKHLFNNYNYFYDLKKNEKRKKFEPNEIIRLHDEYIVKNNYTDILIL